ncbi:hypothetical protein HDV01_001726 [Terramyces sp. JEL0728]|nr:hypothetical protein HDV01_001726 [Terramyces sp. JEL0728]
MVEKSTPEKLMGVLNSDGNLNEGWVKATTKYTTPEGMFLLKKMSGKNGKKVLEELKRKNVPIVKYDENLFRSKYTRMHVRENAQQNSPESQQQQRMHSQLQSEISNQFSDTSNIPSTPQHSQPVIYQQNNCPINQHSPILTQPMKQAEKFPGKHPYQHVTQNSLSAEGYQRQPNPPLHQDHFYFPPSTPTIPTQSPLSTPIQCSQLSYTGPMSHSDSRCSPSTANLLLSAGYNRQEALKQLDSSIPGELPNQYKSPRTEKEIYISKCGSKSHQLRVGSNNDTIAQLEQELRELTNRNAQEFEKIVKLQRKKVDKMEAGSLHSVSLHSNHSHTDQDVHPLVKSDTVLGAYVDTDSRKPGLVYLELKEIETVDLYVAWKRKMTVFYSDPLCQLTQTFRLDLGRLVKGHFTFGAHKTCQLKVTNSEHGSILCPLLIGVIISDGERQMKSITFAEGLPDSGKTFVLEKGFFYQIDSHLSLEVGDDNILKLYDITRKAYRELLKCPRDLFYPYDPALCFKGEYVGKRNFSISIYGKNIVLQTIGNSILYTDLVCQRQRIYAYRLVELRGIDGELYVDFNFSAAVSPPKGFNGINEIGVVLQGGVNAIYF